MDCIKICVILTIVLCSDGISISEQLAHVANKKAGSRRGGPRIMRRYLPDDTSVILGAPTYPSHLPEAEPIQPGHTLLRPSMGILKSAVKFPHREMESESGVYGHVDNLGIKYAGRNERVLYSGFRRMRPKTSKYDSFITLRFNN